MKIFFTLLVLTLISSNLFSQSNQIIINFIDNSKIEFNLDTIKEFNFSSKHISVEEFTITSSGIELEIGESYQLDFEIFPENATNKNITWSVEKDDILSIDQTGNITALKSGESEVYGLTEDNEIQSSTSVIVKNTTSVEILEKDIKLYPNPTNDLLKIDIKQRVPYELVLHNLEGQVFFSGYDTNEIELTNFSNGTYFITIIINNNYYNYQIIKN